MSRPVAFNHVGIVVPDLEAAIAWYSDVMGFTLVAGPFDLRDDGPNGAQVLNVLGKNLKHLRQAHMSTANSVGLELFQPVDPAYQKPDHEVEFWRGGSFTSVSRIPMWRNWLTGSSRLAGRRFPISGPSAEPDSPI